MLLCFYIETKSYIFINYQFRGNALNTADLKTFTTVYECSSFSQASKKLFLTPQGIAKTISRLENELDIPLFIRTKKGITPTEYADALYEKSKDIQLIFSDIATIKSSKASLRTTISILSAYGFFSYLGYSFLHRFTETHPNIILNTIEVPDSLLPTAFEMKKANIGFMMGPVDDYKFKSFYITTNQYTILLPEEHPLSRKSSITLKDLAGISLAIKGKEYNIYPIHLNKFIKKNIYPNIELETSDDDLLFEYAANRHGGAVILDYQAELERYAFYMQKYHLTTRRLSDATFSREIYFVEPVNARLTPAESAFKEYIYSYHGNL